MITSEKCWLQNECVKYKNGKCVPNTFCEMLFKIDALFNSALLEDYHRKKICLYTTINNCGIEVDRNEFIELTEIKKNIVDNVNKGKNYYIYSATCGNGKTSWAVKLLQTYIGKVWYLSDTTKCRALFISVPKFLLALKANIDEKNDYANHILKNVLDADVVVWDDIGTKTITQFEAEHLLSIIDSRLNMGKSNIYTSNLDNNQLYEVLGQRLASRVINLPKCIHLQGEDKRALVRGE